ncbi:ATP-binding cassette domain-containing protein [Nostocoides sp. F2B08]|uniref:ABC transporter ATP-binding protein n=1 Tax=Nostocoides sp. F2B08 TaxID=2653936 RepID=UPI001262C32D|nr:ABC transporter ATP-binding protein [Tetrasphaera sp. F2B08]KAB7744531.1 ATP-binding cassette domain-containing protein [Tetrasphaera sp. F2B08]
MSAPTPSPTVVVESLRKSFRAVEAVRGASWTAQAGRVTAVLGSNGAGKTTTLECLEGLQRPDSGTVSVLGADPWRAGPEHRARVGVMLQDGGLPNTRSAPSVVRHMASLYASPQNPDDLLARLGVPPRATSVRRLSGGERQRVALAVALVGHPDVAFLDEPTAGLDPHARMDVWDVVEGIAGAGACVVVTTHSFEEAERIADDVVVMDAGVVVASGDLATLTEGETLKDLFFRLTRSRGGERGTSSQGRAARGNRHERGRS